MKPFKRLTKQEMQVIGCAFLFCAVFALIALFAYGPRFSTNDDVIIKAVLNGDISGVPESHPVVRMVITGLIYRLLYTVFKKIAWYDECVFAFHMLVYFLFLLRVGQLTKKRDLKERIPTVVIAGLFLILLDFRYLVLHQFTILAALSGALGLFYFATLREKRKEERLFDYIVTGCALVCSLLIRQEVFYMTLPFFGIVFLYRFLKKADRSKIVFVLILGLTVLGLLGIEKAAYSSDEWKEFKEIHSNRVQIYDYYHLPSYESEAERYRQMGVRETDLYPLGEWDLGLFEDYFADGMEGLATLGRECWERENDFTQRWVIKYVAKRMISGMFEKTFWPAGWIAICSFPVLFVTLLIKKKWKNALLLLAAFLYMAVFSGYFIYRGRFPERVSYGLYFTEICVFAGIFFSSGLKIRNFFVKKELTKPEGEEVRVFATGTKKQISKKGVIIFAVLLAIMLAGVILQLVNTAKALKQVKTRDADWDAMNAYFVEHPENMYYLKTASFASYGEKMFNKSTHEVNNFVRLGAWFVKSPIHERYLALRGGETWKRIRTDEHVYYVEDEIAGTDWIERFYAGRGIAVNITVADTVTLPSGRKILVVSIREN